MGELDMYVSDKLDKYGYVDVDISRIMQHVRNKLGTCKRKNKSLSKVRNLFKIENLKLNLKTEKENLKLNDATTQRRSDENNNKNNKNIILVWKYIAIGSYFNQE